MRRKNIPKGKGRGKRRGKPARGRRQAGDPNEGGTPPSDGLTSIEDMIPGRRAADDGQGGFDGGGRRRDLPHRAGGAPPRRRELDGGLRLRGGWGWWEAWGLVKADGGGDGLYTRQCHDSTLDQTARRTRPLYRLNEAKIRTLNFYSSSEWRCTPREKADQPN